MRSGRVRIEEDPELDLAVLHLPDGASDAGGHRFGGMWMRGLHPMAINNATDRFASCACAAGSTTSPTATRAGCSTRRAVRCPRVDLRPFAAELSSEELGDADWIFEGAESLNPRLYVDGADESRLPLHEFRSRLETQLRTLPPAWDPYN